MKTIIETGTRVIRGKQAAEIIKSSNEAKLQSAYACMRGMSTDLLIRHYMGELIISTRYRATLEKYGLLEEAQKAEYIL